MKNQYVGDVNDYRKYGLIDLIAQAFGNNILFVWMLTEGTKDNEGNDIRYLLNPGKYRSFNEILFDELKKIVLKKIEFAGQEPQIDYIKEIEKNALFERYKFVFIDGTVQDNFESRSKYFEKVYAIVKESDIDIIFLDPDNGIETGSVKRGKKGSSKYVYWDEIRKLFDLGKDLLIYQHFPYVDRKIFTEKITKDCRSHLPGAKVVTIKTKNALFILIVNVKRADDDINRLKNSLNAWKGELDLEPLPELT